MPPDGFHLRLNALSTCGPQIAHGRGQISVTQPLLHGLKVDTRLETPGREGGYELAKLILGWGPGQCVLPSASGCASWGAGERATITAAAMISATPGRAGWRSRVGCHSTGDVKSVRVGATWPAEGATRRSPPDGILLAVP